VITISRAARQADFPARFQLLAAMNPCPCGYLGHISGKCRCSHEAVLRYQDKLSGPLLDRIDLQIEVPAVAPETLAAAAAGDASATIAERVTRAYAVQLARQGKPNHQMTPRDIDRHCRLDSAGEHTLRHTMRALHWSARAYFRVLKVARTIADIDGLDAITAENVSEAIGFRRGLRERAKG
jgi:magnesium chelatase family protein